jgi:hypothetical protein
MLNPAVTYLTTLPLKHNGDCSLLGVTPDSTIYAEEFYGENGLVAQHELRLDGSFAQSVDEGLHTGEDLKPLTLPTNAARPKPGWHAMTLNFTGARHRGMRVPERIADVVQPLALEDKMAFVDHLKLNVAPLMLLGIAESYVLAECDILRPNFYFVCRRLRFAVALPEVQYDSEQQPYDYETRVVYTAHFYDRSEELPHAAVFTPLTDEPLYRPMDCLLLGDRLFIADGGEGERLSAIHIWQVELPGAPSKLDALNKKIYG